LDFTDNTYHNSDPEIVDPEHNHNLSNILWITIETKK